VSPDLSADALRALLVHFGPWAPAVYVVGFAIVAMVGVPRAVLTLAGGLAFGPVLGVALAWSASIATALLGLHLGRALGEFALERRAGPRLRTFRDALNRRATWGVLLTRLTPVPFAVCNYALGALGTATRPYLVGSAVGLVPGSVTYALAGASVAAGRVEWAIAAAGVFLLVWLVRRPRTAPQTQPSHTG
jgi:uncharacterized membrane protein YdjX (TVP38/TMEM64 family)